MKEELLALRKKMKRKKPDFIRQDAHKKMRLGKKWRKPKGLNSKMRQCKDGKRKSVSTGYGSPKEVKGLTKEGLRPVFITSKNLENINKKEEGVVISSKLGNKKRIEILRVAQKQGINIINIKNVEEYIKKIDEKLQLKKKQKKKEEEVKKGKEKKRTEKEEDLTTKISEEERKEREKEEKDKILKKRDLK